MAGIDNGSDVCAILASSGEKWDKIQSGWLVASMMESLVPADAAGLDGGGVDGGVGGGCGSGGGVGIYGEGLARPRLILAASVQSLLHLGRRSQLQMPARKELSLQFSISGNIASKIAEA